VRAAEEEWRGEPRLEFYVDFETVNDLWDDFSRFSERLDTRDGRLSSRHA
jgi:hypothetical protein